MIVTGINPVDLVIQTPELIITNCSSVKLTPMHSNSEYVSTRVCLHGDGGPQVGDVTCGGSTHLSCKRDQIEMGDYMDRRVTPPKRVTSSAWGPYLLSNWFMWILRDAKRSLPSITPASVFITKFWPETWLLVRKRGKSVRARRPLFNFFSSLRASSLWHSGSGAGKGRRACNYVSEI